MSNLIENLKKNRKSIVDEMDTTYELMKTPNSVAELQGYEKDIERLSRIFVRNEFSLREAQGKK